ncbi:MAG: rhomboid family intramembrane serine protease [Bacteroidales bacterium]|jgi:membrane associated rhomboid family serine protease|nr:rhomboid family intramembrane serine protease [Bacteroidales bacterium]
MVTLIIVIITSVISVIAFSNRTLFARLQFNPYQVWHRKEWYRIITHGFLHADWVHLIINMLVLFSFGRTIEMAFRIMNHQTWMKFPMLWYVIFYLSALVVSSLTTLHKHKNDIWYNSVGASGAVSAVLFCSIFFDPHMTLLFMGIIPIKAFIFGPLYLLYSYYSARRANDHINHDAHLLGAVFGFCFPMMIDVRMIRWFIEQF